MRCLRLFEGNPFRAEQAALILGRIVTAGLLLLMVATWRLWQPQSVFPRVPFFGALRGLSAWPQWIALAVAIMGLGTAFRAGLSQRMGRGSCLLAVAALAFLIASDQHRFQPWAYENWLLLLILASLPAGEALAWSRLLVVSIYFYSAVSKLNWSFIESGGGVIVDGLLTSLNLAGDSVSAQQRQILAGLLPAAELLVAAGLCWSRSRKIALAGSIVMHLFLLAALGPWGADQKPGVLIWNALFVVQNVVLFGMAGERPAYLGDQTDPESAKFSTAARTGLITKRRRKDERAKLLLSRIFAQLPKTEARREPRPPGYENASRFLRAGVRGVAALAVLFPMTEPFGLCDVWPAWGVYATGGDRLRVYVDETDRKQLPPDVQPYVEVVPRFIDGRCLVRIDRWSLDATRAPLYPLNRFRLGVVLALAETAGLEQSIHVEIEGPADRWTGKRSSRMLTGSTETAAELNRDWLNGFPSTLWRPVEGKKTISLER